jgi:hypothetical protein
VARIDCHAACRNSTGNILAQKHAEIKPAKHSDDFARFSTAILHVFQPRFCKIFNRDFAADAPWADFGMI